MAQTVAIASQKGGSGKTTSAVTLAAALGERGRSVLLIDLDPQGSASAWLGCSSDGLDLSEVFSKGGRLQDAAEESAARGVTVAPGGVWLVEVEHGRPEAGLLRCAIEAETGPGDPWDLVLLDCPPSLGPLTVEALIAADLVLVPVEARFLALRGLAQLQATVEKVREGPNPRLELAILPCRVDRRARHGPEVVERLRREHGVEVFRAVIPENVSLSEAPAWGRSPLDYAPGSTGAKAYRAAARELERRLRKLGG